MNPIPCCDSCVELCAWMGFLTPHCLLFQPLYSNSIGNHLGIYEWFVEAWPLVLKTTIHPQQSMWWLHVSKLVFQFLSPINPSNILYLFLEIVCTSLIITSHHLCHSVVLIFTSNLAIEFIGTNILMLPTIEVIRWYYVLIITNHE